MKIKINEVQQHRIKVALSESSAVLREIKSKPLKGQPLACMKTLEAAVQGLELFDIMGNGR
jgi:hypothetical protein